VKATSAVRNFFAEKLQKKGQQEKVIESIAVVCKNTNFVRHLCFLVNSANKFDESQAAILTPEVKFFNLFLLLLLHFKAE